MKKIVVIGGGIAGAGAAYTLAKAGYDVTVVEKSDYIGGRIRSQTQDDVSVEMGATFLTDVYSSIFKFLDDNGLSDRLQKRKSTLAIVRNGKLHWLSSPATWIGGSVISHKAKFLLGREALLAFKMRDKFDVHDLSGASELDTETVEQYLSTPAGQSLKEYFIQPGLAGYCFWEPERTSRALIPWILRAGLAGGSRYMLRGGLDQIPKVATKNAKVLLSAEVKNVERLKNGQYKVVVHTSEGTKTLDAHGVVCATTATVVPKIIHGLHPAQREFFSSFQYSSTAVVAQRFRRDKLTKAQGIAFPRSEGKSITAVVSETSVDSQGRFVEAVKMYANNKTAQQLLKQPKALVETMLKDASGTSQKSLIKEQPDYTQLWPEALPEFNAGQLKKLRDFRDGKIEDGSLVFAGDYLGGPFMEGAFTSGIEAAERLITCLGLLEGNDN